MTLAIDRAELAGFVYALFAGLDDRGFVSLRAFRQFPPKGEPDHPLHIEPIRLNLGLEPVIDAAERIALRVSNGGEPAVFAPPICTFIDRKSAKGSNVHEAPVLSVEIDQGDLQWIADSLSIILGARPTIVMLSGSIWTDPDTQDALPKGHLHWRLNKPARGPDQQRMLRRARDIATLIAGGDPTATPQVHPLRWPGTWNRKSDPPVMARTIEKNATTIDLIEALASLEDAAQASNIATPRHAPHLAADDLPAEVAQIAEWLRCYPTEGLNRADWNNCGMAIHRATGGSEAGYEVFRAWSATSPLYNEAGCRARWDAITGCPPTWIGARHLRRKAREHGWTEPEPDPEPDPPEGDGVSEHEDTDEKAGGNSSPPPEWEDANPGQGTDPDELAFWPDPVDILADSNTGAPILTSEHVPDALWPFVRDTAERLGVATSSVALGAIVAAASVISEEWAIQPKQHDYTWTEQARLWGGIIGPPSILKSPIIATVTAPVVSLDIAARKAWHAAMNAHKAALAAWKKDGKVDSEPTPPRHARYMVEDTSIEALQEVLRDDLDGKLFAPQGKVLVRRDELSEFLASMDRYATSGSDRGAYLRLYNGGRFSIDRIGRGSFVANSWSGCILGGIQPDPIQRIASQATDDGLLQRFMFDVPAPQARGQDRAPDHNAVTGYRDLFPALAAMRPARSGEAPDHHEAVILHRDAHAARDDIDRVAFVLAVMPDASPRLQSALGKWPGTFARLCLTFHLIEIAAARARGEIGPPVAVVSAETAGKVQAFMRGVLAPNMLRADALMFATRQTDHAAWVAGYILAGKLARITARDIVRGYGALRPPERRRDLDSTMDSLTLIGWVEPEAARAPTSAPTAWRVNPRVHVQFAARAEAERKRRDEVREAIALHVETLRGVANVA